MSVELLNRLVRRLRGIVTRGTLAKGDASPKMQSLQVKGAVGEVDDAEHFEPYGFTAAPHNGAEVLILNVGADASHPVVIVAADRRYRVKGLVTGEVCVFDDQGQRITLYRDRIEVEAPRVIVKSPDVQLGTDGTALTPPDGVVTGQGIDTFTGATYFALGNASGKVAAGK